MDYVKFGQQIRQARRNAHITQAELAKKLGVSLSFVGHIERGTRATSLDTLVALCNELKISPHSLLEGSLRYTSPAPSWRSAPVLHEPRPDSDQDDDQDDSD